MMSDGKTVGSQQLEIEVALPDGTENPAAVACLVDRILRDIEALSGFRGPIAQADVMQALTIAMLVQETQGCVMATSSGARMRLEALSLDEGRVAA